MSASSIVLLGNGFDVALDYKTRYSDFYKNSQDLRNLADSGNMLCKHIVDNIKGDLWSDLEVGLYLYSLSITKQYGEGNISQAKQFKKEFNELRSALFNYLNSETQTQKGVLDQHPVLGLNVEWDRLHPDFLTFNYSLTTFITASMGTRRFLNSDDSPNDDVFIYQHGSIYDSANCKNNAPEAIVLGIDEGEQKVEKLHSFLYKSHQNLHDPNDTILKIENRSIYIIYGCSLGQTDASYFSHIFKPGQEGKTFLIYYYGDSGLDTIMTNISYYCNLFEFRGKNHVHFLDCKDVVGTRQKTHDIIDSILI